MHDAIQPSSASDRERGSGTAAAECVIFVGLQGAGKTTFYNERFAETHVHVSKDDFPHARNRNERQRRLIVDALASGRSVVVDNTNPTPAVRAPVIAAARAAGASVVGYYFDVPVRLALMRNRARQGRARVPDAALLATAKKLSPPSHGEGFDRLYRVSYTGTGEVHVEAIPNRSGDPS
jgi:predicted kinase